jgi:hypothetical protein
VEKTSTTSTRCRMGPRLTVPSTRIGESWRARNNLSRGSR